MKDFLGDELNVGDTVIFPHYKYADLTVGIIVKITEKTVFVKFPSVNISNYIETYKGPGTTFMKHPKGNIIKTSSWILI